LGLGGFIERHATEEPAFDDPGHLLIVLSQSYERPIEIEEIGIPSSDCADSVVERDPYTVASPLVGLAGAGVIDEDVAHDL
jgi:hypothetical protein